MLRLCIPSVLRVLGDLTPLTTRESLSGFLVILSMVLVLVETTVPGFLVVMGLLPMSEVLTDVIFLVAVVFGLSVTDFLFVTTVLG